MECGKLTAKLRDAVPVCFIVDGKEVKRYKNIEIPDEVKKLPFKAFDFNVSFQISSFAPTNVGTHGSLHRI